MAATSPLLAWREPVYVGAGLAGVAAMAMLLLQPLLAGGYLPGLAARRGKSAHGLVGAVLLAAIAAHVIGLWLVSPPDVVDALLFRSPTPFAAWGVAAMWAALGAGLFAALRRRLRLAPMVWRLWHMSLATAVVLGGAVHAMLIEGTMGPLSKAALCALVLAAWAKIMADRRPWTALKRRRA